MTKDGEARGWSPVRNGDIYCSPRCGHGCTHSAYLNAVAAADALAARIGPDWKPHVWENLGWHYAAHSACDRWKVHAHLRNGREDDYTAFLGPAGEGGGIWAERGETPQEAIEHTKARALAQTEAYAALLDMKLRPREPAAEEPTEHAQLPEVHGHSGVLGGSAKRTPVCKCGSTGVYSEKYDAYYCPSSNVWLEAACADENCEYRAERPERAGEAP